jgi:transposase
MKHHETLVVGGVDAHADTHHAAALDERGALLGSAGFAATTDGYGELFRWLSSFGKLELVAVESTGSYAAGLVRYLRSQAVRVLEVNEPHPHTRRRLGKSDPLDAELAARAALSGKAGAIPKQTDGIVESIRQLRVAPGRGQGPQRRHGAAKGRARHGSRAAARAALRAQDDPRQGEPLPPTAARPGRVAGRPRVASETTRR